MSIEIKDVSKTFKGGVKALDHINLEIGHGIFGLLGENGAGKTTLMRLLTTILPLAPGAGTISLNGISYQENNYEKIQARIGYLPQELQLYPDLRVRECLEYLGELSGVPKQKGRERLDHYLEKTSMSAHQHKKIKQLSGGMKRRVGLIQALLGDPEFLIVDEPTTGLDPEERVRIRNLLVDFSRDRTVLFSTHVVEDLAATTNQVAVLNKGRLLYTGSVQQLLGEAKGHIWVIETESEEEARYIEAHHQVAAKQFTETGLRLTVLSQEKPGADYQPAAGNLEEAYMYLMNRAQLGQ